MTTTDAILVVVVIVVVVRHPHVGTATVHCPRPNPRDNVIQNDQPMTTLSSSPLSILSADAALPQHQHVLLVPPPAHLFHGQAGGDAPSDDDTLLSDGIAH